MARGYIKSAKREIARVLAFDLAWLATGWALVEVSREERVIKTGLIVAPRGKGERKEQERAKRLFDEIVAVIISHKKALDLLAYESSIWQLAAARKLKSNLPAILSHGAARGILWHATRWAAPEIPLVKYDPNEVQRKFRAGLVIPRSIREEIEASFPSLDEAKLSSLAAVMVRCDGFMSPSHHESDAIMLAVVAGREFQLERELSKEMGRTNGFDEC